MGGTVMSRGNTALFIKKLSNNESWYYLAEIYDDGGHTDGQTFLNGISGESIDEVIDIVNRLYDDLMLGKTLVIEDVEND
jgi:hypothetical protein